MLGDPIGSFLRSIAFFFDKVAYSLIPNVYEILIYLASFDFLSDNDELQNLMNHIYVLLGIFMLFKVSFSILQYIIDPNAFSDHDKGFGKLVTNVIVAMVLLVTVPMLFTAAFKLQSFIIKSNAIGQLILGESTGGTTGFSNNNTSSQNATVAHNLGIDLQFLLYGAFASINEKAFPSCATTPILGSQAMANNSSSDPENADKCLNVLDKAMAEQDAIGGAGITLNHFFKGVDDSGQLVDEARNLESFGPLISWNIDGQWAINYLPIVSAFAGAYVVILLIMFCVEIAVRSIKLCFLQIIAPIAIISYVDPKESVRQGKLHNWLMECLKTYGSLFLRLATLFLVIKLIQIISLSVFTEGGINKYIDADYSAPSGVTTGFIYVFLIIGAFVFAQRVPKAIEGIFGVKSTGEMQFNPFKAAGVGGLFGAGWAVGNNLGMAARVGKDAGSLKAGAAALISSGQYGFENHDKGNLRRNSRNNTYKDIMGNEFARTSLAGDFMHRGGAGKRAVGEVSEHLSTAYDRKRVATTELAQAEHAREAAYDRQQSARAAIAGMQDRATADAARTAAIANHGSRENLAQKIEAARKAKDEASDILAGKGIATSGVDYQSQFTTAQAEYDRLSADLNEYDRSNSIVTAHDNVSSANAQYERAVASENAARSTLSAIDVQIDTLKKEKSARETVYRVDKTPQKSYKKTAKENPPKK